MNATIEVPAPGTYYSALINEAPQIEDAIDDAAIALADALKTGRYRDGQERDMADAVLADVDADGAARLLWGLLCDRLSYEFMNVRVCVLDNTEDHGYAVVTAAAKVLYDGIVVEWSNEPRGVRGALQHFVVSEISDRSRHDASSIREFRHFLEHPDAYRHQVDTDV